MKYPITKLPLQLQTMLFLIGEELKSRKLSRIMQHRFQYNNTSFLPCLDRLILFHLGVDHESEEAYSIYNRTVENRSHEIREDHDSVMTQALKCLHELADLKKQWPGKEDDLNLGDSARANR